MKNINIRHKITIMFGVLVIVTSFFSVFGYLNQFQKPLEKTALANTAISKPSLTALNIGNGNCSNTDIYVGMYFDCFFDLVGGSDFNLNYNNEQGPTFAYITDGGGFYYPKSENCFIEQIKLKCLNLRGLPPNGADLSVPISLNMNIKLGTKTEIALNRATIMLRSAGVNEFAWLESTRYSAQYGLAKFNLNVYEVISGQKIFAHVRKISDNSLVSDSSEFTRSTISIGY